MKKHAIIVAGGTGARIKSQIPKQFLLLKGKPILIHTLERFYSADPLIELIVVLPEREIPEWNSLCMKHHLEIPHTVVAGGETRFHSVKNGLATAKNQGVIAVHDGARPFASSRLINKCFDEAEKNGNSVPCVPVSASVRKVIDKNTNEVIDRNSVVIIQTPQCFDSEILKKAYQTEFKEDFTDDACVVEFSGHPIHLTEGEQQNIKITYPFDLKIAEAILTS